MNKKIQTSLSDQKELQDIVAFNARVIIPTRQKLVLLEEQGKTEAYRALSQQLDLLERIHINQLVIAEENIVMKKAARELKEMWDQEKFTAKSLTELRKVRNLIAELCLTIKTHG